MREIKFRAWDPDKKKMELPTVKTFLGLVFGSDGTIWTPRVGGALNGDTPIFMKTALIPMQYTGLKDKNGKEVYEGDILAFVDNRKKNPNDVIGAVSMGTLYDSDGYSHEKYLTWVAGRASLLDVHKEGEVIGNIYENKELLNG